MPSDKKSDLISTFYIDACVFLNYLNNQCLTDPEENEEKKELHRLAVAILEYGEQRKCRIVTSAFTEAEVCKVHGLSEDDQEKRIKSLFASPWIREINFERKVAEVSRTITRRVNTKPADSIHIATAIRHAQVYSVDYFVTFDGDFLKKKNRFLKSLKDDYPVIKKIEITKWPPEVSIQQNFSF